MEHSIQSGLITLDFVYRLSGNRRTLAALFHMAGTDDGIAVRVDESELLSFPKFQKRCLEVGAGLVEHSATKNAAGRREWADAVSAAIKAGQGKRLDDCTEYTLKGGER